MIIKQDNTGKTKSIFKCDRCNAELITDRDERYRISVQEIPRTNSKTKKWDLCRRCYLLLCKGIKKGVPRKE